MTSSCDAHSANRPKAYTILRIKRKRTEEPLDALVVESRARRKKSRGGGLDVFRFAQTVEDEVWRDERTRLDLQNQISKLTREQLPPSPPPPPPPPPVRVVDEGTRRYTIQPAPAEGSGREAQRRPTSPPRVVSARELAACAGGFTMYDAVRADEVHDEVDKFLPMLQEYLALSDVAGAARGDDYVWDVFYRGACSRAEWQAVLSANAGTLTGLPPSPSDGELSSPEDSEEEDNADEDSNAEEYYKNDYPDEVSGSDPDDDVFHEDEDDDDQLWQ